MKRQRYEVEHFGINFSTTKCPYIYEEIFCKPDEKVTTFRLVDYLFQRRYWRYFDPSFMRSFFPILLKALVEKQWMVKPNTKWVERALIDCNDAMRECEGRTYETYCREMFERYCEYGRERDATFEMYLSRYKRLQEKIFATYNLEKSPIGIYYSQEFCNSHAESLRKLFRKNMEHYFSIPEWFFEKIIENFLKNNPEFIEIKNLEDALGVAGYYIMVLGKYKQIYVGKSYDIAERVFEHWTKQKPFDRRLFGGEDTSKLSIDSFGAYDTTRIFVMERTALLNDPLFDMEDSILNCFPNEITLNRVQGGDVEGIPLPKHW